MSDMSYIFDGDDDPNQDPLYRKYIILPELGRYLMSADLNHEDLLMMDPKYGEGFRQEVERRKRERDNTRKEG